MSHAANQLSKTDWLKSGGDGGGGKGVTRSRRVDVDDDARFTLGRVNEFYASRRVTMLVLLLQHV